MVFPWLRSSAGLSMPSWLEMTRPIFLHPKPQKRNAAFIPMHECRGGSKAAFGKVTCAVAGHSFITLGKAQGYFLPKHADEGARDCRKECSGKLIITRALSKIYTPFYTLWATTYILSIPCGVWLFGASSTILILRGQEGTRQGGESPVSCHYPLASKSNPHIRGQCCQRRDTQYPEDVFFSFLSIPLLGCRAED